MRARPRKSNGVAPLDALTERLAYGRVSGREQADEGLSLPNQFRRCRLYNAELPGSVAGEEFCDVDSGRNDDRTHYQRMLLVIRGLIAAGKRVSVTVLRLDRLGRTARERVRIWEELDAAGVEIHAIEDGGRQQNKLVYTILAAVAENEAKLIGDRVCDVWDALEAAGWHKPGRAPWGYRWRTATSDERVARAPASVLERDEADGEHYGTADAAREMWVRYGDGASGEAVLRWIAGLPDAARGGRRLMGSGVRTLLRSPVYVGRVGGPHDLAACVEASDGCEALERPRGRWAPLIDDETWMRAHAQYRTSRRLPSQASGEYLLTGILRCMNCGGRMVGNAGNRARGRRDGVADLSSLRRYVCSARLHGDAAARAQPCYATVLARKIDDAVLELIAGLIERAQEWRRQRVALVRGVGHLARERAADGAARQVGAYQKQLTESRQMLSAASQHFFRGDITKLAYDATAEDLTAKIEQAEHGMAELRGAARRSEVLPVEEMLAGMGDWPAVFRDATDHGAMRQMLEKLVVRVRPVRVGHGRYDTPSVRLTALGVAFLDLACGGVAGADGVVVEQLDTANRRTATLSTALVHGAGHADDHSALGRDIAA